MTEWTWDYNPNAEYVTEGLPPGVVAEVERLATELAALGESAVCVGRPNDKEASARLGGSQDELIREGIHRIAMAHRVWAEPFVADEESVDLGDLSEGRFPAPPSAG
ncbi:hypothetical protein [Streptomyces sp. BH055]|uniref:hypothetical protein n=1 Tax=Streptomyces sp. BH055 TaxID=3401173 RepID=UPI003BB7ED44